MFLKKFEIARAPILTEIQFEEGLFLKKLNFLENSALIIDENVAHIYGEILLEKSFKTFTAPAGEKAKTRGVKESLEDWLHRERFGKDVCLYACGGGALLDLAGFTAATFCRGVKLIYIPSTLLAMIDAGLGGKNGINLHDAKNSLGTHYFPEKTIIDPLLLQTLPKNELNNGFSEMIKHGLCFNADYFENLCAYSLEHKSLNDEFIKEAILESIDIKMKVVVEDPYDLSKRALLNFGHTLGHALESVLKYEISHGEAVALGMIAEAKLSHNLNLLSQSDFEKVIEGITLYHEKLSWPKRATIEVMLDAMRYDKKRKNNRNRLVLLSQIGQAYVKEAAFTHEVDHEAISEVVQWMQKNFYSWSSNVDSCYF